MMTETLSATPAASPGQVLAAIKSASLETGSDFDYLLTTALRESNLDNKAKSKSSSATGLFQFIDQTWLSLVKRYGSRHGLEHLADAISQTASGRYEVESPAAKSAILALREDPEISALMAGEAAVATERSLEFSLGREVGTGELYAAHFLGKHGARRLIGLNEQNSAARADLAFPKAAKTNRAVFYHADGRPKTVSEVHAWALGQPVTPPPAAQQSIQIAAAENASDGSAARGSAFAQSMSVSAGFDRALPRAPLVLSANVLEILSAFAAPPLAFAKHQT